MLKPSKYSHPDQTVIFAAYLIILRLKEERTLPFDELKSLIKKQILNGEALFIPALNFLYLTGVIEYRQKNDSFEYVGDYEAI